MTIKEPVDSTNPSAKVMCSRCSAFLPPQAIFCSSCGEQIKKKKNEDREADTGNADEEVQGPKADDTLRIRPRSRAYGKDLQASQLFQKNGATGQISKSRWLPQDGEAPRLKKVTLQSTPMPDIDTEEYVAVLLAQHSDTELLRGGIPLSNASSARSLADTWGWLPVLSLTSTAGVLLVALAYEAGRITAPWGVPLFWVGLLMLFLPIAWRLLSARPARRERIALLPVLGIGLYFVKFFQYPLYFTYFDEFTHWRTTLDIVVSGHLFHPNPILPISAFYPGLEIATSALSSLTGLPIFTSGILLIGVARLIFVLALYLFYEQFTNSARAAGIATMLYMANPAFLFFDADFGYESFALSLAVFVLFAVALRCYGPTGRHRGLTLVICLGLGAVVIIHHVTSFTLVAFLLLWTLAFLLLWVVASFYQSRSQKYLARPSPGGVALLGLVLTFLWLTYTKDLAVAYLGQYVNKSVHQLMQILGHERAPRQLFQNVSGFGLPLWERMIASTSVALILLGLAFGFFQIWRRHRTNAVVLALAVAALMYPMGQALRLIPSGAEAGTRTTEFAFLGVAFVLAIGATEFWFSRSLSWRRSALAMVTVGIIFFGQMILSTGASGAPLPGPYAVAADAGSIEPEGIDAAKWTGLYLGPDHRIASDRTNMLLMMTYGDEWIVKAGNTEFPVAWMFTSPQFGLSVEAILQQDAIQYVVVDRRLSTGLPHVGTYFDLPATQPIDPATLAKFDHVKNVSRVFDSGDIQIYDVEAITNGPSLTSAPEPSCVPGSSSARSFSYPNLAKSYSGTLHDIPTGRTINISLTGIQQQREAFCGSFGRMPTNTVFSGMSANGSFKGTIATDGQLQFTVTSDTGRAGFSFEGVIQSDGSIAGTYCNPQMSTGQCSVYGLWSVSPARSR